MKYVLIVWAFNGHVGKIPTFAIFNTKAACEIVLKEAQMGFNVGKDSHCIPVVDSTAEDK